MKRVPVWECFWRISLNTVFRLLLLYIPGLGHAWHLQDLQFYETSAMVISWDAKSCNSKKEWEKERRAVSIFLQKVTLESVTPIMILFYLWLTGGSTFNKTHRMIAKKWILTFPRAFSITLFLCKVQPSKNW